MFFKNSTAVLLLMCLAKFSGIHKCRKQLLQFLLNSVPLNTLVNTHKHDYVFAFLQKEHLAKIPHTILGQLPPTKIAPPDNWPQIIAPWMIAPPPGLLLPGQLLSRIIATGTISHQHNWRSDTFSQRKLPHKKIPLESNSPIPAKFP